MRLLVHVQSEKPSLRRSFPVPTELSGVVKFTVPVRVEDTFGEVWTTIEERCRQNYKLPTSFVIKKLQDVYSCDLDLRDTVGAIFEGVTDQEKMMVNVLQAPTNRELSIPPTSHLRPFATAKRPADSDNPSSSKRRRIHERRQSPITEELLPGHLVRSKEDTFEVRDGQQPHDVTAGDEGSEHDDRDGQGNVQIISDSEGEEGSNGKEEADSRSLEHDDQTSLPQSDTKPGGSPVLDPRAGGHASQNLAIGATAGEDPGREASLDKPRSSAEASREEVPVVNHSSTLSTFKSPRKPERPDIYEFAASDVPTSPKVPVKTKLARPSKFKAINTSTNVPNNGRHTSSTESSNSKRNLKESTRATPAQAASKPRKISDSTPGKASAWNPEEDEVLWKLRTKAELPYAEIANLHMPNRSVKSLGNRYARLKADRETTATTPASKPRTIQQSLLHRSVSKQAKEAESDPKGKSVLRPQSKTPRAQVARNNPVQESYAESSAMGAAGIAPKGSKSKVPTPGRTKLIEKLQRSTDTPSGRKSDQLQTATRSTKKPNVVKSVSPVAQEDEPAEDDESQPSNKSMEKDQKEVQVGNTPTSDGAASESSAGIKDEEHSRAESSAGIKEQEYYEAESSAGIKEEHSEAESLPPPRSPTQAKSKPGRSSKSSEADTTDEESRPAKSESSDSDSESDDGNESVAGSPGSSPPELHPALSPLLGQTQSQPKGIPAIDTTAKASTTPRHPRTPRGLSAWPRSLSDLKSIDYGYGTSAVPTSSRQAGVKKEEPSERGSSSSSSEEESSVESENNSSADETRANGEKATEARGSMSSRSPSTSEEPSTQDSQPAKDANRSSGIFSRMSGGWFGR